MWHGRRWPTTLKDVGFYSEFVTLPYQRVYPQFLKAFYGAPKKRRFLGLLARAHLTRSFAFYVIFLVGLCLVHSGAHALTLDPESKNQEIVSGIRYFVEVSPINIDQIHNATDITWQEVEGRVNFGYNSDAHWFKVKVNNLNSDTIDRLLHIRYPLLDHIGVYHFADGEARISYGSGDALPFSHRPYEHRQFLFPLSFEQNSENTIYIRVKTSGALQVPLSLWDERAFFVEDSRDNILTAMYYGVLLIMAAFNLMLFFSMRDRPYLYYVYFVGSMFFMMSSLHGYSFQYIMPNYPTLFGLSILMSVPLTQIAICMFTIEFLRLPDSSPTWYRIFIGFISVNVLMVVGALVFPYGISTRLSVVLTLPIAICAMFVGVQFWKKGDRSARLFSIAWIAFLVGVASTVLNRLGVLPTSFFTEQGIPITTTIQTVIFSLALAARFNAEREGRLQAQQEYLEEIRKRREAETQLVYSASHHEITGLPNRLLFEKSIRPYIEKPDTGKESIGIFLLHVRRFDDVNKTLGHRNADVLLRRIGERINSVVCNHEGAIPLDKRDDGSVYVAHIEGVSFCFAIAKETRDATLASVDNLMKLMSAPVEFMGLSIELSFLVGSSFAKSTDSDPQTLLRQAFIAFDRTDVRASSIAVYEPQMNPYSPKRLTLMTELRSAIEYDGLELYFQPQIDLKRKRVAGFEALLRWNHHDFGFVPPDEFIPMAEKTGLMKPLTRWVMQQALQFSSRLKELNCDALISINISALNLREIGFCEQVIQELNEAKVEPNRLVLEVTETAAMVDPVGATNILNRLNAANVRLSIDDFGTGHSSLAYIRKLPVHEIKIDRSFVMSMHENKGDATIVRTIINMCHDLGYDVVAEGVENQEIVEQLQGMKCDIIQGFHISRPMNAKNTLEWLQDSTWSNGAASA